MELRKKHVLRISSIEKGKSEMDAQFERDMMEHMQLDVDDLAAAAWPIKDGWAVL